MLLYLIGFMGSGKSSLGPALANRLGIPFTDLDEEIVALEGMAIREIFQIKGEAYFRKIESEILHDLDTHFSKVVATGGGTPCFHHNMDHMLQTGIVFYLDCSPEVLRDRLLATDMVQRPLLRGKSPQALLDYIRSMLADREIYYRKAHFIIDGSAGLDSLIEDVSGYAARFKKGF